MNETELDVEYRSIISHAFLGEDQNISRESFDLAINGCVEFHQKQVKELPELFQQAKDELYRARYERNRIRPLYYKLVTSEKNERLKKWAEIYMDENLKDTKF